MVHAKFNDDNNNNNNNKYELFICVYVCIYVCIMYAYMHVHVYVCLNIYMYACRRVFVFLYMDVCISIMYARVTRVCVAYLPTIILYISVYVAVKPAAEESFRLDTTLLFCENIT